MKKVLIWVQHLLGTGHIFRSIQLAQSLCSAGFRVQLLSGGPIPSILEEDIRKIKIRLLPFVRAKDARFNVLLDADNVPITEAWKQKRAALLWQYFHDFSPDFFITETFPFGRRAFQFELNPILTSIQDKKLPILVLSSVRDILVTKNHSEKDQWMASHAKCYYDHILVHSDENLIRFEQSFPLTNEIQDKLVYTGFINRSDQRTDMMMNEDGKNEIIISCGGGAVGANLLKTTLQSKAYCKEGNQFKWRFLIGSNFSASHYETLIRSYGGDEIIIEKARPDFPQLLKRARLSISQAGYNTIMDCLSAKIISVLVPFSQEEENEQTMRAEILQKQGLAVLVSEETLNAKQLAQSIDQALSLSFKAFNINLSGAESSANYLHSLSQ